MMVHTQEPFTKVMSERRDRSPTDEQQWGFEANDSTLQDPSIDFQRQQRSLIQQRQALRRTDVITKTLHHCAGTIGLRSFLADKNVENRTPEERQTHVHISNIDPEMAGASSRERFLKRCSDLFCKYAEAQGMPPTPIDCEGDIRYVLKTEVLRGVIAGLENSPDLQRAFQDRLPAPKNEEAGGDGDGGGDINDDDDDDDDEEAFFTAAEFMKACFEACPYPLAPSPRRKPAQPPLPSQQAQVPDPAVQQTGSRRRSTNPDILVEAVKAKARAERKRKEVQRWVISIFDRLYEANTQQKRVNMSMRPDMQDPFIKCGRVRVKAIHHRKRREEWGAIARNLSSTVDLMAHHANKDRSKRQKEVDSKKLKKRVAMVRRAITMSKEQLKAHREQVRERNNKSATRWRQGLQEALRQVNACEADRVEKIRRNKTVMHLSEFTSSAISADPDILERKKAAQQLSDVRKCETEQKKYVTSVRSQRLRQWKQKTRDAYLKALQGQVVLPYLEAQKTMDGGKLFSITDDLYSSPRGDESRVGQWRTRTRDVMPSPRDVQDYILVGDKKDGMELPFAMRSAERVYGGDRSASSSRRSSRLGLKSSSSSRRASR